MASSSKRCTEEGLQKAKDDLRRLRGQNPIPKGFQPPNSVEHQQGNSKEENKGSKGEKKKKKKKLIQVPPELVDALINVQCMPLRKPELPAHAQENYRELCDDLRTAYSAAEVFARQSDERIRILQDQLRREVETKGCLVLEVTDDEAEDDVVGSMMGSQQGPRGGRRSHRPGVIKRAGGASKLI